MGLEILNKLNGAKKTKKATKPVSVKKTEEKVDPLEQELANEITKEWLSPLNDFPHWKPIGGNW